ncbi:hypothetical protein BS78_02G152400 [Paspalum vaginatum]|nr:hypothetical protein BS78_02G152400 [Paspalum vaginatum]
MDAIPNDVLKLILPRISSPVCLIRAAATCKNWRRIIAADGILSRFLSLHAPPVAGVYYNSAPSPDRPEPPAFVPSPAGAAIYSRHFSLDFLPHGDADADAVASRPWPWRIVDSRGSLLLLVHRPPGDEGFTLHGNHEVVVCEPLTRRLQRISPCAGYGVDGDGDTIICAYLLDGDHTGGAAGTEVGMSSFRVLCVVYGNYRYRSRVFTSGGSWREISIDSERMNRLIDLMGCMGHGMASLQHRVVAGGGIGSQRMDLMGITAAWLYWYTGGSTVVAVDRSTAEATWFVLPAGTEDWDRLSVSGLMRAADGPDGSVRLVVSEAGGNVKIYAWIHGGWALEKSVSIPPPAVAMGGALPPHSHFKPWELLPFCAPLIVVSPYQDGMMWRLCLDGETAELERVAGVPYPCKLPWPLPFHFCADHDGDAT